MSDDRNELIGSREFARILGISSNYFHVLTSGKQKPKSKPPLPEPAVKTSGVFLWYRKDAEEYARLRKSARRYVRPWEETTNTPDQEGTKS